MVEWGVPLLSAAFAAAFAGITIGRYAERRRSSDAAWSVGLVLYALASLAEAWGAAYGWNGFVYRAYYPTASGLVGFLGLGTLFLLKDTRIGTAFTGALIAAFTFIAFSAAIAPIEPGLAAVADPGLRYIVGYPRATALVINVVGGLVLIGGALWGWVESRRGGLLVLALGALIPFTGGSLASAGLVQARSWAQLTGVAVMFIGFLMARRQVTQTVGTEPVPAP